MALTHAENDLLTRVEHGAPMGEMLRQHYWFPVVPSSVLVADGAPTRIRLTGKNYVAFRASDGSAGVLDEQCVHRKASLALAPFSLPRLGLVRHVAHDQKELTIALLVGAVAAGIPKYGFVVGLIVGVLVWFAWRGKLEPASKLSS